ncbi:MAG: hypothetical protein ACYCTE_15480 [Acidimicrobiales bacterium]
MIWIHSSSKAARDASARATRIEAGLEALEARLVAPRSRLRTRVAVEEAAALALEGAGATWWVRATVTEETKVSFTQERRGRPGAGTRYRRFGAAVERQRRATEGVRNLMRCRSARMTPR